MGNVTSLIFYVISFVISCLLYKLYNKHNKKIFLLLSFLIPFVIGGFRYYVGTDYENYINLYNNHISVDIGFNIISYIARMFGDYKIVFIIYNSLTLIFTFLGIKNLYKSKRALAYFIYLFVFYTTSFNAMRQMLAVSITFFAYKYINEKKLLPYCLFLVLAFCFHNSSILALLLYPILTTKNNKIKALSIIALVAGVAFYQEIIRWFSSFAYFNHFEMYTEYTGELSFNNLSFYLELMIFVYILIFRKKLFENDENNSRYLYIYLIGIVLTFSGFFNPYIKRIAISFNISSIILLASIPSVQKNSKYKLLNYVIIIVICFMRFMISAYFLKQGNIIPYNFFII